MASTTTTATTQGEGYDFLILTDATSSMGNFIRALNQALPEVIRISDLTRCFDNIGIAAYRDYTDAKIVEWSGWYGKKDETSQDDILKFAGHVMPSGGADWPEAAKTGLHKVHEVITQKTIVILYADAPPHLPATGGSNMKKEKKALDGTPFGDWVTASKAMSDKAQVFSIISGSGNETQGPFAYLSHKTGGTCFELPYTLTNPQSISTMTISLLLAWAGVSKAGTITAPPTSRSSHGPSIRAFNNTSFNPKKEDDPLTAHYWGGNDAAGRNKVQANLKPTPITFDDIRDHITPRKTPIDDFSHQYKADLKYREWATAALAKIIDEDVKSLTVNPVIGSLWRTVCNDRNNEARDGLITAFGFKVEQIVDADTKTRLKTWLAESYDYKGEILEMISEVPAEDKYPCVFLDPTVAFSSAADDDIRNLSRDELLEIGRSCDYRILRRLGKVLTRFTYVESAADLPSHVKDISDDECPKLPLALAQPQHKRKFWKLLLHLVLPGTMLSPRPAALLAALSIKMGILPLRESADTEMLNYKEKWNTLEIPETWNTSCLSLLLDADTDYRSRAGADEGLFSHSDRTLFEKLVDYKLLEHNLSTTLTARIGWTPEKQTSSIGPLVICKSCHHPRSVTVMASNNTCGICLPTTCTCGACTKGEDHTTRMAANISEKQGTWVECFAETCRAQYIVYNPSALNVRAKCFYCRHGSASPSSTPSAPVPTVECSKCLSRMIWPLEYRPTDLDVASWKCPPCDDGKVTIIDFPTTAEKLSAENGRAWLLRNDDLKIPEPLAGGTLFKTISKAGIKDFVEKVEVLPVRKEGEDLQLSVRGKAVRNSEDVVTTLSNWVKRRRAEAGTCSLCFSDLKKSTLRSACGRKGCHQHICESCRGEWYGINGPGKLINTAALSCPFCRRLPAPRVVRRFGLHALPGLREAVAGAGEYVYGWCQGCGSAKEYMERVCAAGAPANLVAWRCGDCPAEGRHNTQNGRKEKVVECPGCKTPTEKMSGCDHIACPVAGCGKHWCWSCSFVAESSGEVYGHMQDVHGGIYGGEEYEVGLTDDEEY